ncbi:MAG TPA: hypothetical protein VHL11_18035 [Phototrophicaceae bacterium]|nr:hypothetical protein [Phototrophicaceae bacterium]
MMRQIALVRIIGYALLCSLLCACGVLNPGPTATPDPLDGKVALISPPAGSVIYASALYIAGTLADVPTKALLVRVVDDNQTVIAQARVDAISGDWSTELIHGYSGDPNPVTVQIVPAIAPDAGVLASSQIVFAPLADRPEGTFVTIATPTDGTELGGDSIPVTGTASGIPENAFMVDLLDSSQQILAHQQITLAGRYPVDEIPWSTTLVPGDYIGNAIIRITLPDGMEQSIAVVITSTAG